MRRTAASFPPIETWMNMSEGEQEAVIHAIEMSRRRRSRIVPILATATLGTAIAVLCYFVL